MILRLWQAFLQAILRFFRSVTPAPKALITSRPKVTIARRLDGTPASAWQAHRGGECDEQACWYCDHQEAPRPVNYFYKHPLKGKNHRERRAMFAKAGNA